MNINEIVIAVVSLCVISAIIGIALSIAEKVFHVEVNEQEVAVREALPVAAMRVVTPLQKPLQKAALQ